jgi:hypothetical protein
VVAEWHDHLSDMFGDLLGILHPDRHHWAINRNDDSVGDSVGIYFAARQRMKLCTAASPNSPPAIA